MFAKVKKFLKGRVFLVVVLFLVFGIYLKFTSTLRVKTVPAKEVSISQRVVEKTVSASGEVKSNSSADLSFKSTGDIVKIYVKEGENVKKGQILVQQDNYYEYSTAKAYKDAYDIALRDRDLYIENYETNISATGGADEYRIQLRRYDEYVSKAKATYDSYQSLLNDTYLNAPFGGTVLDISKTEGETSVAGETVVKLADLTSTIFEITLDQEDFGNVKLGQKVKINLDAYGKKEFNGVVTKLPKYANGSSNPNFTVEITLSGYDPNEVLLGMTGDAHIVVDRTEAEVPSVLYDEVFYDEDDKPYIWVVENGYAKREYVEIGLEGDVYTEIKGEIEKKVIIPIDTKNEIREGYRVKIVK